MIICGSLFEIPPREDILPDMDMTSILTALDAEISRLQQARAILNGGGNSADIARRGPGRPKGVLADSVTSSASSESGPRRTMSAEGKAKIAAAQRARWAKQKKAAKA